jgi:3-dehydroquinate synthase
MMAPMAALPPRSINVAWFLEHPAVPARAWHPWVSSKRLRGQSELGMERRIEAQLAWPPGTIAALNAAFELPLSRSVGWDISAAKADAVEADALRTAARWFRRGVACRDSATGASGKVSSGARETSGSYDVRFLGGKGEPAALTALGDLKRWFVLDGNVAANWPVADTATPKKLTLVADESQKTLECVATILDAWRGAGKPMAWTVVSGGLIADVAAFAAALAGASFRFVPTTLLAMADACVGGKTGVNFPPFGKNQVGAFAFPDDVAIWPGWLETLPERERHAGGAECMKHALLANDLPWAERLAKALVSGDLAQLGSELPRVVSVKAEVVARDPGEAGERAILNFGHTIGHALEGLSQRATHGTTTLLHGEAVGYGMIFALLLSKRVAGMPDAKLHAYVRAIREGCAVEDASHLQQRLGGAPLGDAKTWEVLTGFLQQDKKAETGAARWVLLGADGTPSRDADGGYTRFVSPKDVEATWRQFIAILN